MCQCLLLWEGDEMGGLDPRRWRRHTTCNLAGTVDDMAWRPCVPAAIRGSKMVVMRLLFKATQACLLVSGIRKERCPNDSFISNYLIDFSSLARVAVGEEKDHWIIVGFLPQCSRNTTRRGQYHAISGIPDC